MAKKTAWCPRLASSNSCFHDDQQTLISSYSYSHSITVPAVCYHGDRAAKVCMIKTPVLLWLQQFKLLIKRDATFSSDGMVSLSLAMRLHTCSMPRLRNSSLCTTSEKCCSVSVEWERDWDCQKELLTHTCNKEHNYYDYCVHTFLSSFFNGWTQTCIRVGEIEQLHAGVQIGEGEDSEAVGWVKLSYEKLAAGLFNFL